MADRFSTSRGRHKRHAIADGKIRKVERSSSYGNVVVLEFEHHGATLYAYYCHLSLKFVSRGQQVKRGEVIALTGNTGNASSMHGEDQHLHFEIRTVGDGHPEGLTGRMDPALLYGRAPLGWTFYEVRQVKTAAVSGQAGLKVPGVNVRERLQ